MKHISLCGIKHAGKSTVSRFLCEKTGWPAADTDERLCDLFLKQTGKSCSVREIYKMTGEDEFRKLEAEAVRSVCANTTPLIIALGGGALSNPFLTENDRRKLGWICWLDEDDKTAFERIMKNGLPPFLASEKDPFEAFCKRNIQVRSTCKAAAHFRIRTAASPEDTAEQIITAYRRFKYE